MRCTRLMQPFSFSNRRATKLQFVHIPKCGGVGIFEGLCEAFPGGSEYLPINDYYRATGQLTHPTQTLAYEQRISEFRQHLLLGMMNRGVSLIGSHLPFSPRAYEIFHQEYRFHTVLRDPEERFLSHLLYTVLAEHRMTRQQVVGVHAKNLVPALEAKLASPTGLAHLGNQYIRYIGGLDYEGKFSEEGALERAIAHLDLFEQIGFLDRLEEYRHHCRNLCGRVVRFGRKNTFESLAPQEHVGDRQELAALLTDEVRERLAYLWVKDLTLYNLARNPTARRQQVESPFRSFLEATGAERANHGYHAWMGAFHLGAFPWIHHEELGWCELLEPEVAGARLLFRSPQRGSFRWEREDPETFYCLHEGIGFKRYVLSTGRWSLRATNQSHPVRPFRW